MRYSEVSVKNLGEVEGKWNLNVNNPLWGAGGETCIILYLFIQE